MMKENRGSAVLQRLEQECREKGIRLIYDDLRSEGGVCRLRDRLYVIANRRASNETRARLIREALGRLSVPQQPTAAPQPQPAAEPAPVTAPISGH